jgi:hypothetical protein
VAPTGFRRRTAGVHQADERRVRIAAPSDRGDVEPIAEVIHLPRLELLGAQLAALEDGVGAPFAAGVLVRSESGRLEFPDEAVKVEFLLEAAWLGSGMSVNRTLYGMKRSFRVPCSRRRQ